MSLKFTGVHIVLNLLVDSRFRQFFPYKSMPDTWVTFKDANPISKADLTKRSPAGAEGELSENSQKYVVRWHRVFHTEHNLLGSRIYLLSCRGWSGRGTAILRSCALGNWRGAAELAMSGLPLLRWQLPRLLINHDIIDMKRSGSVRSCSSKYKAYSMQMSEYMETEKVKSECDSLCYGTESLIQV